MDLSRAEFIRLALAGVTIPLVGVASSAVAGADPHGLALADEDSTASAAGAGPAAERPYRIVLATDLHYLAPELIEEKGFTPSSTVSSGSMITVRTDQIADALVAEVKRSAPDCFVMPGDLTYNAESLSHARMLEKLTAIQDAGIPVLTIAGNHDVGTGKESYRVADFLDAYAQLGPAGAISRDDASGSYLWPARDDLRLLFLDVNCVEQMGVAPASTLAWADGVLADAQEAGVRVISFSHQNLLVGGGYSGLDIENATEVIELYERRGVPANFSGHVHGQFVIADEGGSGSSADGGADGTDASGNSGDSENANGSGSTGNLGRPGGLYDIATASLAIYPLLYATIDIYQDRIEYQARPLDVSRWARESGQTDPSLLDFSRYAHDYLYNIQYASMFSMLEGLGANDADAGELSAYFAELSCAQADMRAHELEPRPDLLERFLEIAGESTASRFAYGFVPGTREYAREAVVELAGL